MNEKTDIEITEDNDGAVVTFQSSSISDVEAIAAVSTKIKQFIEERHPIKVVFDFTGVKFFSSQVLGLLLDVRGKLQAYNGEVVISAINPQLHKVFRITNLDRVFRFFPNRKSAVRAKGTG
jgi:anti-anti-sigma factor